MNKRSLFSFAFLVILTISATAQVPRETLVAILKAEDALSFDAALRAYLESADENVRARAVLAAGRIGDPAAVPAISAMLSDRSDRVRSTAAFALGEIESTEAAGAVLGVLRSAIVSDDLRARAVEAAGKIAAANSSDPGAKELGEAILDVLEGEVRRADRQSRDVVLAGLTAALRARPPEADLVIAKFFTNKDDRIRADAANAYSRVRGKAAFKQLQSMLLIDEDPVARANAARALGVAEDKTALNLLFDAAETDDDLRVRVSALRSIGQIGEPATANRVLKRVEAVFIAYKASKEKVPAEQNELLEAASALGRVAAGTADKRALELLKTVSEQVGFDSPEIEAAIAVIDPAGYMEYAANRDLKKADWRAVSAGAAGYSAIAAYLKTDEAEEARKHLVLMLAKDLKLIEKLAEAKPEMLMAIPSVLALYSELNPPDADTVLRGYLAHSDVFIRATAASEIGGRPANPENLKSLSSAFTESLTKDKYYDDAKLAMLSALVKLDKQAAKPALGAALNHYEIIVRRRASELIRSNGLEKEFPEAGKALGGVLKYDPKRGSKLGQVTSDEADYKRALSRRNGTTRAVVSTEKGEFTIEFFPEEAPLTVDNFIDLANGGYFNGIEIHRVVANFVVQDGDPRGDGNGGPGWQIRCEINRIPYERGMVGMALSGKDTGGSQWFITHAPQPHLDGGYTVFGRVNEEGMKVVDRLVRGDRILKVRIEEER